jgi:hypothetical protein
MTKYVVQRILGPCQATDPRGQNTIQAATMQELCKAWNKDEFYEQCILKYNRLSHKRKISVDENGLVQMSVTFPYKRLKEQPSVSPKCVLAQYCTEHRIKKPIYESVSK